MKFLRYAVLGAIPFLFTGCIFTKYEVIEKPQYVIRPMPILKEYKYESDYTFKGLVKEQGYIKVPEKQFEEYVDIKINLEGQLDKANEQVRLYNQMAIEPIIQDKN